LMLTSKTMDTG